MDPLCFRTPRTERPFEERILRFLSSAMRAKLNESRLRLSTLIIANAVRYPSGQCWAALDRQLVGQLNVNLTLYKWELAIRRGTQRAREDSISIATVENAGNRLIGNPILWVIV